MRLFRDIGKLSPKYIPRRLPHREEDIDRLSSFFPADLFLPNVVQLVGPAGCGKTSVSINTGKFLSDSRGIYPIYINLKMTQSKHFIYSMLIKSVRKDVSTRSMGADELLYVFLKYLEKIDRKSILILDEVGYYVNSTGDSSIIYDLTRLTETPNIDKLNVVGVILISRNLNWHRVLDESQRSSLGQLILKLKPYSKAELIDILQYRCSEAFYPGKIEYDILEYIADTTVAQANSDVRYALDVAYYAGILAERMGSDRITFEHVREVISQTNPSITTEDLLNLSKEEKKTLLSVALALKYRKRAYVTFTEIYDEFKEIYGKASIKSLENNMQLLEDKGLIVVRGLKRIGLNVPTTKLIPFLEKLIERIKETY